MKQIMKKLSWFWIIFALSPLILLYFTHIKATAIWCWAWGGVWYLFIVSKSDGLTRGLVFIVASVFVAIAGKTIIGPTEHAETIEMIQNVILLISGGVGGNFMAAYLQNNPATSGKRNGDK